MMNKKSLYKLEYNKIIEKLTEHAGSFGGQERCRKLKPKTEIFYDADNNDDTKESGDLDE